MCHHCDYTAILESCGIEATKHRLRVLEVIGENNCPLSAQEIYETVRRSHAINRVTVYRILDLLVDSGVADKLSGGGRSAFFGLAPNENHQPHPHFFCRSCGSMNCLNPESLSVDVSPLARTFPGKIEKVEVRIDGICRNCIKSGG